MAIVMYEYDSVIAADSLNVYGDPIPRRLDVRDYILNNLLAVVIRAVEFIISASAPLPDILRVCVINQYHSSPK